MGWRRLDGDAEGEGGCCGGLGGGLLYLLEGELESGGVNWWLGPRGDYVRRPVVNHSKDQHLEKKRMQKYSSRIAPSSWIKNLQWEMGVHSRDEERWVVLEQGLDGFLTAGCPNISNQNEKSVSEMEKKGREQEGGPWSAL